MTESCNNNMDAATGTGGSGKLTPHSVTPVPSEIEDFMQQLKSDRLIKIFIGDGIEQQQLLVQESVLTGRSEYFQKAIKHEGHMGTQAPGVLRFPEDGHLIAAWGMMLHWIIHQRLLTEEVIWHEDITLLVEFWALGDRLLLRDFQNAVMMQLLKYFAKDWLPFDSPELVNYILRISPADTPLRRLLAEETVSIIYSKDLTAEERLSPNQLTGIEGVAGITGSLLDALEAFTEDPNICKRIDRDDKEYYRTECGTLGAGTCLRRWTVDKEKRHSGSKAVALELPG
ncbi:hypothetical protein M409DRAFT_56464 [Zasmidium cellare ATCC 36951]|uniref:BTB domain-containing protein n=1 Tax=Zasmidium cellare ATCC 36951 TaxID=1080233 RepID=A0A6A6CD28_ZASCE|nr:uncharacterized protein M409DRAFT_56464 [Zasmidium cellare ATCC 36951]KAF2164643.1 hypothetical protein M409DRAFT_56464 [Zasmidium cellare ATCC 36951]